MSGTDAAAPAASYSANSRRVVNVIG